VCDCDIEHSCVVCTFTLLDCNMCYCALFVITITLITVLHLHVMVGGLYELDN